MFKTLVALADTGGQDKKAEVWHSFSMEIMDPFYSIRAEAKSK